VANSNRHNFIKQTILLSGLFLLSMLSFAQEKEQRIKLLNADQLLFDDNVSNARKLLGNVRFKQGDMLMYCDSAYLFAEKNTLFAYSNVKLVRGDTVTITGDSLKYYGDSGKGELRGFIEANTPSQQLNTNYLDFNTKSNTIYYLGGGKILQKKKNQTLRSKVGYYYGETGTYFFKDSVDIIDSSYRIQADTLQYNIRTEFTKFLGPTYIFNDSNLIYCESGFVDRATGESEFTCNAFIQSKEQIIEADSIRYNQETGLARCYRDVVLTDTANSIQVRGDYGYYSKADSTSLVTGRAEMIQAFTKDSLFMHADTLFATTDSAGKRLIHCYNHVRFFKPDMRGKCDSLTLSESDSLLEMYTDPVIWNNANQITGEHIQIKTYDGVIEHMEITENAFIISQQDTTLAPDSAFDFNQIKGRNLLAFFRDNDIYKINITGNGQTIYYAEEEDGSKFGLNRLDCSNMTLYLDSNQIKDIRFYVEPKATLHPIESLTPDLMYFRYFSWRYLEKPASREDIFLWRPKTAGNGLLKPKEPETDTKKEN
jgi:lipopolysaccharide export system protein LptA